MKLSDARIAAIILCAGTGSRANLGYNKILHYIGKKTILETTLDTFLECAVHKTILVVNQNDLASVTEIASKYRNVEIVSGGKSRTESARNGINAARGCDIVAIHDGARPFVTADLINRTIESAAKYGSGIAAVHATDTVRELGKDGDLRTLPREKLWNMQTPQTFIYEEIADAYARVKGDLTDDAEAYLLAGYKLRLVQGEYENIKVTNTADLYRGAPARTKIGAGFDVHRLITGRDLIIGGVKIEHDKGLYGHSDADVLTHAVMDALLSAAGMPDIGVLFPDTDAETEGISSLILLDRVVDKITEHGYRIADVSAVIMAQSPKMAPHIPTMRKTLSAKMAIDTTRLNISATTTEGLGIIGEEKGIAASATCLLRY